MDKKKCTAIVLSAGQGKRMGTAIQKQYIELSGKPIIFILWMHSKSRSSMILYL